MMRSPLLLALAMGLPLGAAAQAYRCTDAVTGKTLYTDQPCKGGETVVPRRSEADLRLDAENAAIARERLELQQERSRQLDSEQSQAARQAEAARAWATPAAMVDSDACRSARAEADFRARSNTASEEAIRTARYNAALACGQQPPADIVVVPAPHIVHRPRPVRELPPVVRRPAPPPPAPLQVSPKPNPSFRIGAGQPEPPR